MDARIKHLQPVGIALSAGILVGLLACGGKSTPSAPTAAVPAQQLSYTNPPAAGYRLVKDESSTASHLVLKLVGPSGAQIKGGVFTLNADTSKAVWGNPGSATLVQEGGALALGAGTKLMKGKVSGQALEAAIFQKGTVAPATLGQLPILAVALDLKAGATKGQVTLTSPDAQILDAAGKTQTVTVVLGTLSAE